MNDDLVATLRANGALARLTIGDLEALAGAATTDDVVEGGELSPGATYLVIEGEIAVQRPATTAAVPTRQRGDLVVMDSSRAAVTGGVARATSRLARFDPATLRALGEQRPQIAVALALAAGTQLARDFRALASEVGRLLATTTAAARVDVRDYDVVVIGAGPVGVAYAMWVAEQRPGTRVAVLDRRSRPAYKIGESTVGPSVRAMKSLGMPLPVLRRLFEGKFGLTFFWAGGDGTEPGPHFDAGHFDETFQIERRVLEMALHASAERRGVDIVLGTRVIMGQSTLGADGSELVCEGPDGAEVRYRTRMVCDASGPAAVVPRAQGLYHKRIDSFQTNAYFGYFRQKAMPDLPYWDTPMTRHLYFPEGWVWFIDLQSFERTPDDRLRAFIDAVLDHPAGPDETYPTRHELIQRFGCTVDEVVSIGIVPRDDLDDAKGLPVEERFNHYVRKYPGFAWIMSHYELVEHHYAEHRSFSAFQKMAHDCERFVGDGWVAIGDAAFFVNPLFSPGLTFGVGTAWMAAHDTVHALNRSDLRVQSFAGYERYGRDLFTQLLRENEMYYRAFAHPDSCEDVWKFKFAQATTMGPGPEDRYTPRDAYLLNLLQPSYRQLVDTIVTVQRELEASGEDPAVTARRLRDIIDPFLAAISGRPEFQRVGFERFYARWGPRYERVEAKPDREAVYPTWRCHACRALVAEEIGRCYVCGTVRPAEAERGHLPQPRVPWPPAIRERVGR